MSSESARARCDGDRTDADRFPDRLDALLAEHWPPGRGRIVGPSDGFGGPDLGLLLAEDDGVARLVRQFHAGQGREDARATASVWSQWYLVTTWPVLVAAALVFEEMPPLAPEAVALSVDGESRPVGLEVRQPARPAAPEDTLRTLVFEQTAPLLQAVARVERLPQRVAWSNAAAVLHWTLGQLDHRLEPDRLAPARALLEAAEGPDGQPNPLAAATPRPGPNGPIRRSCCLRYKLSGFDFCADCPVPHARARKRATGDAAAT